MQEAMYDIKGAFQIGVLRIIFLGYLGADEDFSEKISADRKGDAIGRGGVIKKLSVKFRNFFLFYEMDSDFRLPIF